MTEEANCTWCAAGKYQTGVGLVAEANCTWCAAGKYQSGSGVHMTLVIHATRTELALTRDMKEGCGT